MIRSVTAGRSTCDAAMRPSGDGRQAPGAVVLIGGQGDELVQDIRQVLGPQVGLKQRQELASVH